MSTRITSMIRIGVAALVGTLAQLAVNKWGIDFDGETVAAAATGIAISLYYAAAKWAEAKWPRIKFLGLTDPDQET